MSEETIRLNMWDRIMMAITFAEAGEAETARDMLDTHSEKNLQTETRAKKTVRQTP
jgi:hypothetical protein